MIRKIAGTGAVCLILTMPIAWGQSSKPAFEVASIKLHEFPPGMTGLQIGGASAFRISGNRVSTSGTLLTLVMAAYNLGLHQVSDEHELSDREGNRLVFDIQAKAEGDGAVTPDQVRQMMQTLLSDRFHLKVHHESKEIPVYEMSVDKNGAKLKETAPGTESKTTGGFSRGLWRYTYTNLSMSDLVTRVASNFDRLLLDKTGLKGSYDVTLEYKRPNLNDQSATTADTEPSIFTALQQLGLKVGKTKSSVDIEVIDHAEKPSDN